MKSPFHNPIIFHSYSKSNDILFNIHFPFIFHTHSTTNHNPIQTASAGGSHLDVVCRGALLASQGLVVTTDVVRADAAWRFGIKTVGFTWLFPGWLMMMVIIWLMMMVILWLMMVSYIIIWLVVFRLPLWQMMEWKSVGMMTIPNWMESQKSPWFQSTNQL